MVSKVYNTRLVSVVADNEAGQEIRQILESDGFVGAACELTHEPGAPADAVKVYMGGAHIGQIMPRVAKVVAAQIDAGRLAHGYIKALSYYDAKKESITRWEDDGEERLTACYLSVWCCDEGDDETTCYAALHQRATTAEAAASATPASPAHTGQAQAQKPRGFLSRLFGKK